jgi:hypothetical protein
MISNIKKIQFRIKIIVNKVEIFQTVKMVLMEKFRINLRANFIIKIVFNTMIMIRITLKAKLMILLIIIIIIIIIIMIILISIIIVMILIVKIENLKVI